MGRISAVDSTQQVAVVNKGKVDVDGCSQQYGGIEENKRSIGIAATETNDALACTITEMTQTVSCKDW